MDIEVLRANPHVQRLAGMPDKLFQMLEKTDPLRAEIVKDCREIVNKKTV